MKLAKTMMRETEPKHYSVLVVNTLTNDQMPIATNVGFDAWLDTIYGIDFDELGEDREVVTLMTAVDGTHYWTLMDNVSPGPLNKLSA